MQVFGSSNVYPLSLHCMPTCAIGGEGERQGWSNYEGHACHSQEDTLVVWQNSIHATHL